METLSDLKPDRHPSTRESHNEWIRDQGVSRKQIRKDLPSDLA